MSEAPDLRDEEMLARLAEFDLSAAERVHGKLMAAEEAAEIAELGRTYQRIARSLRQTLALKAKLKRDREQGAKDAPPAKPGGVAVARRMRELRTAVLRVAWDEGEPEDFGYYAEEIDDLISRELRTDTFCVEPLDDHVARICLDFGFAPQAAETWRDLPDPPPPCDPDDAEAAPPTVGDDDAEPAWRGSG